MARWAKNPSMSERTPNQTNTEEELDELWSFVGKKANRWWIWLALDATTRQILAFHVGDRSGQSTQALWVKISTLYRERALFYTDHYTVYPSLIPVAQHRATSKLVCKTNHVEWFNCTLRQRVSRLVRATLSFSKKLTHHIGAIKDFICVTISPRVQHYQDSTIVQCLRSRSESPTTIVAHLRAC